MSKVRVLAGTHKGAFILTSDGKRQQWDVSGPHFAGWEVYHLKGSPADPNRIYCALLLAGVGRSSSAPMTAAKPGNLSATNSAMKAHQARTCGMTAHSTHGNSSVSGTSSPRSPIPTTSTPASKTPPS